MQKNDIKLTQEKLIHLLQCLLKVFFSYGLSSCLHAPESSTNIITILDMHELDDWAVFSDIYNIFNFFGHNFQSYYFELVPEIGVPLIL